MQETQVPSLGWEDPLEEGITTHSSILAWRISWKEEPDGLQFLGSKESDMTEQQTLSLSRRLSFTAFPSPVAVRWCRVAHSGVCPEETMVETTC